MRTLLLRDTPSHDAMVSNVLAVLSRSTPGELAYGEAWYIDARCHAALIADIAGISSDAAAGIIAVLSPQTEWTDNLREAYELATAHAEERYPSLESFRSYPANQAKALAILETPDAVGSIVRGPKVSAFWRAITGALGGPVIDRHATRVATGYGYSAVTEAAYYLVQQAYVDAATLAGMDVHHLQATVWLTCKRELASTVGQLSWDWGWPIRPTSFGG